MEITSDKERIKNSISLVRGRIEVILICREGKVKSPGGRVSEEYRIQGEKREGSHSSSAEIANQQLRWANAEQQREFRFQLGEAAESSSKIRRAFLE